MPYTFSPAHRFDIAVVVLIAMARAAAAQPIEPLFVHAPEAALSAMAAVDGRNAVVSQQRVGVRFDVLFGASGAAERVQLNVGARSWIARFERLDIDTAGFRSWVGTIDGIPESHVVLTERDGVVSGLVNAVGATYQIRTERPGSYLLEQIDVLRLADERDPVVVPELSRAVPSDRAAADSPTRFDVLFLYTPGARLQRGGTAGMEALISQIISDTNTAFARSGILPRVRLAGAMEVAYDEAPRLSTDLVALSTSPYVHALRDGYGADLVQLLVYSTDLTACGVGYLLTSLAATDFPAYSVADIACIAQYTPTHEMGHNMGAHHAPEDGAFGGLFSYSYGFKDRARGFRTIMAYDCANSACGRIPNFSNPQVSQDGGPTGTTNQDNARSINEAALTVANFRPSMVFSASAPPSPPVNLRSVVIGNAVTVSWDSGDDDAVSSPSGHPEYVLGVGTAPGAADVFSGPVGRATSASGVLPDGTYYWRVLAANAAGASAPSPDAEFTTPRCLVPSAPRSLAADVDGHTVRLSWQPPFAGSRPGTFVIEAGSQSGLADLLVSAVGDTFAVAIGAPPGTYFVRVRAQNGCGTSGASNEQIVVVR